MGAIGIFEFGDERHEVQLNIVGQTLAKVRVRNRVQTFVGTFQAGYIEQLTQKTGAFKSFPQFCQLLTSAIQSASIETTLELLTPADLDALRMNKGQQTRQINQERRYLLLVITDSTFNTRVHYPLSLNEEIKELSHVPPQPPPPPPQHSQPLSTFPSVSAAPPAHHSQELEIQTIVRQLQEEIRRLQHPEAGVTFREKYEEMIILNNQLKLELDEANKVIGNAKSVKMNKQMKKMVDHMEKALSDEKARSKRIISDQKSKIRSLEKELTQTKTESKHLEIRNRALSTELQSYKRSKVTSRGRASRDSSRESRISQPRVSALRGRNSRDSSKERVKRPPAYTRPTSSSRTRNIRSRDPSPAGSIRSVASSVGSYQSSCSSRASRTSTRSRTRFDPTAYVKAKKAKENENKRRLSGGRHKSINSTSRHSSRQSTKSSNRPLSGKNRSSTPDPLIATSDDESFDLHNKYGLKESGDSKRTIEDSLIKEGSFNINEIDARLSALQQYMDDLIVN